MGIGDWGLGIGDWGLGVGGWGSGPNPPTPKPQSPIPNPQSPSCIFNFYLNKIKYLINELNKIINIYII